MAHIWKITLEKELIRIKAKIKAKRQTGWGGTFYKARGETLKTSISVPMTCSENC